MSEEDLKIVVDTVDASCTERLVKLFVAAERFRRNVRSCSLISTLIFVQFLYSRAGTNVPGGCKCKNGSNTALIAGSGVADQ